MNRGLVKMSIIACCALMTAHALAQSTTPPRRAVATNAASRAAAEAPKTQTVAANVKAAKAPVAVATIITAAGSVIVLADGIVANATMAQIQPPADGFVYER